MDRPSRSLIRKSDIDSPLLANSERETTSAASTLEETYEDLLGDWHSSQSRESAHSHNSLYNPVDRDSRMTFACFVETKFIPEHVQFKTRAGRIHYQAALKHLIAPEVVNRMFNPGGIARARLRSVPQWPYLDEVRLCDIDSDHVRGLISAANAADYSSQTVKHIKNVLFAVISHAQKKGCFNGPNPASEVKLPKIVRRKQHHLTFEQTKAVLRTLPSPLKEIAVFAISTDMNLGEICDLQWKHVNLADAERMVDGEPIPARTLAVRASWDSAGLWNNKSVCKTRNIEIHEPLLSTLKHLNLQNQSLKSGGRVIVSNTGAPIFTQLKTTLSNQLAKASGLPWLTWQVLRRTRSSFFSEFLSQLSAPRLLDENNDVASRSDAPDIRRNDRAAENANAYDLCKHRGFCFGRRRQGLYDDFSRD